MAIIIPFISRKNSFFPMEIADVWFSIRIHGRCIIILISFKMELSITGQTVVISGVPQVTRRETHLGAVGIHGERSENDIDRLLKIRSTEWQTYKLVTGNRHFARSFLVHQESLLNSQTDSESIGS